jgi:hypothetical protein
MRQLSRFILLSILIVPSFVFAETLNAGFVQGNIWYSKDIFFVGETVRIYSGIFNGGSSDVLGTATFYDNNNLIGSTEFSVAGGGRLREVWVDWKVTEGEHAISAKILSAKVSKVGTQPKDATLVSAETLKDKVIVDFDTDKDGIGNQLDADDDGDGIDDKNDSSPLVKNKATLGESSSTASISDSVPVKYAEGVLGGINSFASSQADSLSKIKERVDEEIEQLKIEEQATEGTGILANKDRADQLNQVAGTSVASTTPPGVNTSLKRFGKQMYAWILYLVIYILRTPWLLYGVILLILYWMFRRWRRHQWEKRG